MSSLPLLLRTQRGRRSLWWDVFVIVVIVVIVVVIVTVVIIVILVIMIRARTKLDLIWFADTIFLQAGPRLILDDFTDSLYASKSTIAFGVSCLVRRTNLSHFTHMIIQLMQIEIIATHTTHAPPLHPCQLSGPSYGGTLIVTTGIQIAMEGIIHLSTKHTSFMPVIH